jgi:hypothetical protein
LYEIPFNSSPKKQVDLTIHLGAVLKHSDLPEKIYSLLRDELNEVPAEVIQANLENYLRRESEVRNE